MEYFDQILFVGKSNRFNNDIYQDLSSVFNVQFCSISVSAIEACLDFVLPKLIVFSMTGVIEDCITTLKYLLKEWNHIPVLGVCDETQQYLKAKYLNADQCKIILRPESGDKMIEMCSSLINNSQNGSLTKPNGAVAKTSAESFANYKPHVLVVDDNAMVLRTTKLMLKEKYSVTIAASGAQALMALEKQIPDVILLDYKMPVLDGEATIKILRGNEAVKKIPVIFFTSADDPDTVKRLITLKPAGYILKPPDKQKLIELIDKTLDNYLSGK